MDAHHNKRFLTFGAENPHAFSARRTNLESPVVRITGLGRAPGRIRMIPDPGGKKTGTTG